MVTRSSSSDMFAVFLGGFRFGEVLLVDWLGWAVLSLCCCGMRLKVGKSKEEAGSGTCVSQASTPWRAATCDYRQESIPLIDKNIPSILISLTHIHTHKMQSTRAFNMLRQRAAPAFRAQQPVRGLRLQSSPKMRSPVPVRSPVQYNTIANISMLTPVTEGGALRFVKPARPP
jgi:hypothetical protein